MYELLFATITLSTTPGTGLVPIGTVSSPRGDTAMRSELAIGSDENLSLSLSTVHEGVMPAAASTGVVRVHVCHCKDALTEVLINALASIAVVCNSTHDDVTNDMSAACLILHSVCPSARPDNWVADGPANGSVVPAGGSLGCSCRA